MENTPHLHIVSQPSGIRVHGVGSYSYWRNPSGKEYFLKGEIYAIPDGLGPVLPADQNTKGLAKRLLDYIERNGSPENIDGQFCGVLIDDACVTAYRSAFSLYLLYFNDSGVSDKLSTLSVNGSKYSFEYLQRFILDYPSLHFSYPLTPLEGVYRLPPASLLRFEPGKKPIQTLLSSKVYEFNDQKEDNREEIVVKVRETLKEILLWHLGKQKPIHSELSGGLDSSFVSSFLSILTGRRFPAHMFSFRKHPSHELSESCARKVAIEKNIDLTIIDAAEIHVPDLSTTDLPYQDEPIETYWLGAILGPVMRNQIERNSFLFSGYACDQLYMRGTDILLVLLKRGKLIDLFYTLRDISKAAKRPTLNYFFQFLISLLPRKVMALLIDCTRNLRINPFNIEELAPQIRHLARVGWLKRISGKNQVAWLYELEKEGKSLDGRFFSKAVPHSHLSYLFATRFVFDPYLSEAGIEYVHPFCDKRMMDFVYHHISWKSIHDFKNPYKQLLREAQRGIVPEDVRLRPFNDFSFDGYYYSFLRTNRDFLYTLLTEAAKEFPGWIDVKEALLSFEKMMMGCYGNSENTLSRLLAYLVWRKTFETHLKTA